MDKKILVACPTYDGMGYCLERFVQAVEKLSYKNKDILIVDNSEKNDYFDRLKKVFSDATVLKDSFKGNGMEKIVHSRNLILDYAVEEGFDFVFMLDQDVIVPADAIERLMACDKDLVSGLYFNIFESSGREKVLPVAWKVIEKEVFESMKARGMAPKNVRIGDLRRHLTSEEVESGKCLEVLQPSFGCILISRNVFSEIKYEILDLETRGFGGKSSDDVGFRVNAQKKGFKSYCHTGVLCGHIIGGKFKEENGFLIHPAFE